MAAMEIVAVPTLTELSLNHRTMFIGGLLAALSLILLLIGVVNASATYIILSGVFTSISVMVTIALHVYAIDHSSQK